MRVVLFTYDGAGLPLALKLQQEGYDVLVGQVNSLPFIKEQEEIKKRRLSLYNGIIEKYDADELVDKLLKEINKEDYFIFCDFNYLYEIGGKLKPAGFKGLLPSKNDFIFEKDRNVSQRFAELKMPFFSIKENYKFSEIDDAKEFLLSRKDKIWGVKGDNPDAPTFFPYSNDFKNAFDELYSILEINKELYEKDGFILEEKIEDLIEFTPEIITFDDTVLGINIDFELKEFGSGNTSFQTGDAASMIYWLDKSDWENIIDKFFPHDLYLRENEMVVWDAGTMYSPSRNAFYFSEFCPNREGYNSLYNKLSTFESVGEYFEKIISKTELFDNNVNRFGSSVRIFNILRDKKDNLIDKDNIIIANLNSKNVWLWDIYMKNGKIFNVGYDENFGVITNGGNDWALNFISIHNLLKEGRVFTFKNAYYRSANDILSTNYNNNLSKRYNFFAENVLGKIVNEELNDVKSNLLGIEKVIEKYNKLL